jgi:hypothetical protein
VVVHRALDYADEQDGWIRPVAKHSRHPAAIDAAQLRVGNLPHQPEKQDDRSKRIDRLGFPLDLGMSAPVGIASACEIESAPEIEVFEPFEVELGIV